MDERQALIVFGALSQETRLRLLRLLVIAGPDGIAAGALAEKVEVSPSNVSFHLKELERAGLVTTRQDRKWIYYALTPEFARTVATLSKLYAKELAADRQLQQDARRLAGRLNLRAKGECCIGNPAPGNRDRRARAVSSTKP